MDSIIEKLLTYGPLGAIAAYLILIDFLERRRRWRVSAEEKQAEIEREERRIAVDEKIGTALQAIAVSQAQLETFIRAKLT